MGNSNSGKKQAKPQRASASAKDRLGAREDDAPDKSVDKSIASDDPLVVVLPGEQQPAPAGEGGGVPPLAASGAGGATSPTSSGKAAGGASVSQIDNLFGAEQQRASHQSLEGSLKSPKSPIASSQSAQSPPQAKANWTKAVQLAKAQPTSPAQGQSQPGSPAQGADVPSKEVGACKFVEGEAQNGFRLQLHGVGDDNFLFGAQGVRLTHVDDMPVRTFGDLRTKMVARKQFTFRFGYTADGEAGEIVDGPNSPKSESPKSAGSPKGRSASPKSAGSPTCKSAGAAVPGVEDPVVDEVDDAVVGEVVCFNEHTMQGVISTQAGDIPVDLRGCAIGQSLRGAEVTIRPRAPGMYIKKPRRYMIATGPGQPLGLEVGEVEEMVAVTKVKEGSPAAAAQVPPGVLVAMNGKAPESVEQVQRYLQTAETMAWTFELDITRYGAYRGHDPASPLLSPDGPASPERSAVRCPETAPLVVHRGERRRRGEAAPQRGAAPPRRRKWLDYVQNVQPVREDGLPDPKPVLRVTAQQWDSDLFRSRLHAAMWVDRARAGDELAMRMESADIVEEEEEEEKEEEEGMPGFIKRDGKWFMMDAEELERQKTEAEREARMRARQRKSKHK